MMYKTGYSLKAEEITKKIQSICINNIETSNIETPSKVYLILKNVMKIEEAFNSIQLEF